MLKADRKRAKLQRTLCLETTHEEADGRPWGSQGGAQSSQLCQGLHVCPGGIRREMETGGGLLLWEGG